MSDDDARERLLNRIVLTQEVDRAANGNWIYVTLDEEGDPVNAGGPYPFEGDAFLAAEAEARVDPEPGWTRKVIPLFVPEAK